MLSRIAVVILLTFVDLTAAYGQTPSEHEQHHPAGPAAPSAPPASAAPDQPSQAAPQRSPMGGMTPQGAGGTIAPGMGGMMGEMMGGPPAKALYPSLMELPELTSERRVELEHLRRASFGSG